MDIASDVDFIPNLYYKDGSNDALYSEIVKISQTAWDEIAEEMNEVLCTVDKSITRDFIDETNGASTVAGNWIADRMLEITKEQNTVAAFINRGGIRSDIQLEPGEETRDITVADIYTMMPFGNRIYVYTITGKQMAEHMENALIGLNP